jgi:phosphotransferase system IIB component
VLAALGGARNVSGLLPCSSRLRAQVRDASVVDSARLTALGVRAIARPRPDSIHLIVGPHADSLAAAIGALL